jgi:KDO2-lipid IV(A) lauroyltransferase
MMIGFQQRVEFFGYRIIEKLVCSIPDEKLASMARPFAFLVFYILRIRRKISLDNLQIAFPEKTEHWRKSTAYFAYLHFSLVILEFMKIQKWSKSRMREKLRFTNFDDILPELDKGTGVIIVSAHFGNWEFGTGYVGSRGVPATAVQQNQKNVFIDKRMKDIRRKWGVEIIDTKGAVKNSVEKIRTGRIVALLGDQDAGSRGIFVPFFSRPASTHFGAAVIHQRTGAPLYFVECSRVENYKIDFIFKRIDTRISAEDPEEQVKQIAALLMQYLEKTVRRYPKQYFWMHKRWKSSPPEK